MDKTRSRVGQRGMEAQGGVHDADQGRNVNIWRKRDEKMDVCSC